MKEAQVQEAFCAYLRERGWDATTSTREADVVATRGGERLIAEVKGTTQATGTDMDTAYGQLLRRMEEEETSGRVQHAIVIPAANEASALRVSHRLRTALGIKVYTVDDSGRVAMVGVGPVENSDNAYFEIVDD